MKPSLPLILALLTLAAMAFVAWVSLSAPHGLHGGHGLAHVVPVVAGAVFVAWLVARFGTGIRFSWSLGRPPKTQ